MIEVKEHLPERDSEQVQKIKCMCTNTIVVYKTVEKKSKLSDIVWDLHLVKDVVIAVLIGIIVGHMNGIETIAAVFTGVLMLIALVHIDCEIHMTVGRKR